MKTLRHLVLLLSPFALLLSASRAAPISQREAYEFYAVLAAVEGVNPDNTVRAADNLVALRPHVEAYEARVRALEKSAQKLKLAARKDPKALEQLEEKLMEFAERIEEEHGKPVQVELKELALTPDEIAAAKLRPAHLAVLQRLKKPKTDDPKPTRP